jgi:glycogen debranching enzyme
MIKDELVHSLVINQYGSAISNSSFNVAPASFNALVAFNALELYDVSGEEYLKAEALSLTEMLEETYDEQINTWTDTLGDGTISSSTRTLDSLLPALVSSRRDRVEQSLKLLVDSTAFGAPYGPCGVDQRERTFDPDGYWRGVAWPQLTYLLYIAAQRQSQVGISETLSNNAFRAAIQSEFSESINPLTGAGRGSRPHSWSCLPATMPRRIFPSRDATV